MRLAGPEAVPGPDHLVAAMLRAALDGRFPPGQPLVAAVAPGNTRAMRVFLAAGFRLVASVQTWRPARHP